MIFRFFTEAKCPVVYNDYSKMSQSNINARLIIIELCENVKTKKFCCSIHDDNANNVNIRRFCKDYGKVIRSKMYCNSSTRKKILQIFQVT